MMIRRPLYPQICVLVSLSIISSLVTCSNGSATNDQNEARTIEIKTRNEETGNSFDWDSIVGSGDIISNGNVWHSDSSSSNNTCSGDNGDEDGTCLYMLTHSQVIRYCPPPPSNFQGGSIKNHSRQQLLPYDAAPIVIHHSVDQRYRGLFSTPANPSRIWILTSPYDAVPPTDYLIEFDTPTSSVVQTLRIPTTIDAHDAVRVGSSVFIVDTRHGNIVEIALPASAEPDTSHSLAHGASESKTEGEVNILKIHEGFTRLDHINNVAVHDDVLLVNVHGGGGRKNGANGALSPTRLSALNRHSGDEELTEDDGFRAVTNAGKYCHNIAFWRDGEQIKLITLDSMNGSLVSIVVSGPGAEDHERSVIWKPDASHPVLTPPNDMPIYQGTQIFAKGLSVQGRVAYFAVSYARAPPLRRIVPESLLVAVDLKSGSQLWDRAIQSHGLINHIVSGEYLGLRPAVGLGHLIIHPPPLSPKQEQLLKNNQYPQHKPRELDVQATLLDKRRSNMRLVQTYEMNGGNTLDTNHSCYDTVNHKDQIQNVPRHMHVESFGRTPSLDQIHDIVLPICRLNVDPILQSMEAEGGSQQLFDPIYHAENNAIITGKEDNMNKFKPGVQSAILIFSTSFGKKHVYHFPLFRKWSDMLEQNVLDPLKIPLEKVVRMQLARMTNKSRIKVHRDSGTWVRQTHRVHVPLITHDYVYFLSQLTNSTSSTGEEQSPGQGGNFLRILARVGDIFEINNSLPHAVANLGLKSSDNPGKEIVNMVKDDERIHLIIDWSERPVGNVTTLYTENICEYRGSDDMNCYDGRNYYDVKKKTDNVESTIVGGVSA
mmetsp:Transcript_19019/g.21905  ORF Transcript_19019/g.21905 Transcript_19019/m.21905 type:complete len:826 (-) Transcript_19019:148-2625(-)